METNIVMVDIEEHVNVTASALSSELEKRSILALPMGKESKQS